MYEDLVARLREADELSMCGECGYNGDKKGPLFAQAADAIERLQKTIPRWIPVTERLPALGKTVLVFGGKSIYTAYYGERMASWFGWHKLNSKCHYCNPTHWMPLPEPPEQMKE